MELINVKLPYEYVCKKVKVTFKDTLYALDRCIVAPYFAIELAADTLSSQEEFSSDLLDLALLSKNESVLDYVSRLAALEPDKDDEEIKNKWLYILLAWLFENKNKFEEPLAIVELLYAEFDYPKSIVSFVKYMPSKDLTSGTKEGNYARMYKEWGEYLINQQEKYSHEVE